MRIDEQTTANTNRTPWWRRDGDVHEFLHAHALKCIDRNGRRAALRLFEAIYTGQRPDGNGESELKVTKNMVSAVFANLSRAQPGTWVMTEGGNIEAQERAEYLTSWLAGRRIVQKTDAKAKHAMHDSAVFGTGAVHTYVDQDDGICSETVWVGDLGVEHTEQQNRVFHTLYRVFVIDREVAKARWSGHASALDRAELGLDRTDASVPRDEGTDMITLVMAWRVRVGKVKGRVAIVASSCTLKNEEYDCREFPIDFLPFDRVPSATFGMGLVEMCARGQESLDKLTDKVETIIEKWAPKWMIPRSSGVKAENLTDTPYEEIDYDGPQPPTLQVPPMLPPDLDRERQQKTDSMFQLAGVFQFSAQGQIPAGIASGSGEAIRRYNETEQAYWYPQSSGFEEFNVALDRSTIRCAEEILASKDTSKKQKLEALGIDKSGGAGALRRLGYEQARFDESAMILRALPVAKLSQTASGRIQDVKDMMDLGIVQDRDERRELVGLPDVKRYDDLEGAGRRIVALQVVRALRGQRQTLDPSVINLDYAAKHAQQALTLALLQESDGDIATLRDYRDQIMTEVMRLQHKQQAAAMTAVSGGQAMPTASSPGLAPGAPPPAAA